MNYNKAKNFIYRHARPIDLARWQYHFENGSQENVLTALAAYQNEDGGFGHALEPDYWNPNSSPIQTWRATEILHEIGIKDKNNPIIQGILKYLASKQEFQNGYWQALIPTTNDFPHAPWWTYEEKSIESWGYNPTISLAGFVLTFADENSELYHLAVDIAKKAVSDFLRGNREMDIFEINCFVQFYEYYLAKNLDFIDKTTFENKLKEIIFPQNSINPEKGQDHYLFKHSWVSQSPESIFYHQNWERAYHELQILLETVNEKEIWEVPWDWSDYSEIWPISKNWWRAEGTIGNLLYMKRMGVLNNE